MKAYHETKLCTECFSEVPESDYDEAHMTRLGIICARCFESRDMGWIPKLPKKFRSPSAESPGERWRRWMPARGW